MYSAFLSYLTILRHSTFQSCGLDLGIFEQSLWNTVNGRGFLYNTLAGNTELADHCFLILLLVVPFYALFQDAKTLLVMQSLTLAFSAIPIYYIARRELNSRFGLLFGLAYLLYPPLHLLNYFDFHPMIFAVPLLCMAFYHYEKRNLKMFLLFSLLALSVKETVSLTITGLGTYIACQALRSKDAKWAKVGVVVSDIGMAYLLGSLFLVSHLHGGAYGYGSRISLSPSLVLEPKRWSGFFYLLSPLGFLSLLNPPALFIPILNAGVNFFSNVQSQWWFSCQYSATLIPFVFISAIKGLRRFSAAKTSLIPIGVLIGGSLLASNAFFEGQSPVSISKRWGPPANIEALEEAVKYVPPHASIATQNRLFPHFAGRENSYSNLLSGAHRKDVPGLDPVLQILGSDRAPEYILIDTHYPYKGLLDFQDDYGIVFAAQGVFLLKKGWRGETYHPKTEHGLLASYYANENLKGNPELTMYVKNVFWNWGKKGPIPLPIIPSDRFSTKFEGYIEIPRDGIYGFKLSSDDGSRLCIDEKAILNGWGKSVYTGKTQLFLKKGLHDITISHMEHEGNAALWLYWKPPGKKIFSKIPSDFFYPYN